LDDQELAIRTSDQDLRPGYATGMTIAGANAATDEPDDVTAHRAARKDGGPEKSRT
jgi:hypothetical protein